MRAARIAREALSGPVVPDAAPQPRLRQRSPLASLAQGGATFHVYRKGTIDWRHGKVPASLHGRSAGGGRDRAVESFFCKGQYFPRHRHPLRPILISDFK